MSLITKPSGQARTAIAFVTAGTLVAVWTGVWYAYLRNYPSTSPAPYYFCTGLFLSGFVLIIIGLGIGKIGRAAREAELPPPEVTQAVAAADQSAAQRAPLIAPINPAQPVLSSTAVARPRAQAVETSIPVT